MEFDGGQIGQKVVEMIGRLNVANQCSPGCKAQFTIVASTGRHYLVSIIEQVAE
jgi:hypothetical protein